MAFRPPPVQPDFEKLRGVINTSPSVTKDKPMWQILITLLDQLKKFQDITVDDIADINNLVEGINNLIVNINVSLGDATFLTTADETSNFPSSVQLLAGTGITFDDSVPNKRTIDSTASGSELPVGSIHSTWINVNAGTMLGYGVWLLFATGIKSPTADIIYTVY